MELNISRRNLTKVVIDKDKETLITHSSNSTSIEFSLVGVTSLICSDNCLTELPLLPTGLKELYCFNNQLTSLPPLPEGLEKLYCANNQLTSLPPLPKRLITLYCANNQLTNLPPLPKRMDVLYCFDNPLKYIPFLKKRPLGLSVPKGLKKTYYSIENYQEGYRFQETNRYLFLTLFTELDLQLDFLGESYL